MVNLRRVLESSEARSAAIAILLNTQLKSMILRADTDQWCILYRFAFNECHQGLLTFDQPTRATLADLEVFIELLESVLICEN